MIALYPGTFDPLTHGHLDIAARGAKLFDKLYLSVSENPKKKTAFSLEERVEMAKEALAKYENIEVVPFSCLLVNFMRKMKADVVIRGLRAVGDFEFEFQLALMNRKMDPNFETVFLMPNKKYIFVSSSMVREVAEHGGDVSPFVPESVNRHIVRLYGEPDREC
jgi:pantetheine-phosphate adenylyltransferase